MPKFFIDPDEVGDGRVLLCGDNAAHIAKTLRMRPGEELTACDGENTDYRCRIVSVTPALVETEIVSSAPCAAEPELALALYMALPKSDKLELVVQKAVELGAARVCVFRSMYCVPDPEPRAFAKRLVRLQKIAREAEGQSLRGRVPEVTGLFSYQEMLRQAAASDTALFFYERGGKSIKNILDSKRYGSASVVIGPEGGFSDEEFRQACGAGLETAYLGARILRCETAAICAVSAVMFHAGEFA